MYNELNEVITAIITFIFGKMLQVFQLSNSGVCIRTSDKEDGEKVAA